MLNKKTNRIMTKNQLKCIAKFIDAANSSWSEPRFFYRQEGDDEFPEMIISSDGDDILSLVNAISIIFCGVCVSSSSDIHRFTFNIF